MLCLASRPFQTEVFGSASVRLRFVRCVTCPKGTASDLAVEALLKGWDDIKTQVQDLHSPTKKEIVFRTSETLSQLTLAQVSLESHIFQLSHIEQ